MKTRCPSLSVVFFVLLYLCTTMQITPSCAGSVTEKEKALQSVQKKLKTEEEHRNALSEKIKEIDRDLENTKSNLVEIARSIQKNESKMNDLDTRIVNLELKKTTLEDQLSTDRASISRLILALERIRRTPPEAMLANPESPYKTAQSALLMGDIIPSVNRHAKALRNNLETLAKVTDDLNRERDESERLSADLKSRYTELSALVDHRKQIYTEVDQDLHIREVSIQKISLQAKNLEDLVTKLKEDALREEARRKSREAVMKIPLPKLTIKPDSGQVQLPISGIIHTQFKQKDDLGAVSKGLTIEARAGALVVAPKSGVISFAGPFKRYGNLIIIEHEKGLHSLVAGLEKIDTVVGQRVNVGEPIGKMPESDLAAKPRLYYELRQNGEPVDPAMIFPDLG